MCGIFIDNSQISSDGVAKVADFGLAKDISNNNTKFTPSMYASMPPSEWNTNSEKIYNKPTEVYFFAEFLKTIPFVNANVLESLIISCQDKDPAKRKTMNDVHAYLKGVYSTFILQYANGDETV